MLATVEMSNIESNPLNAGSDVNPSSDLPARPQRSQRIDHHFLNDDRNEDAPPEHRVVKIPVPS